MPLEVIQNECRLIGTNNAEVVVQGESVEEVLSTKAKEQAILGARNLGMFRSGISGSSGPYPVNEQGQDCTMQVQPGMKYRNKFNLSAGLGA